MEIKNRKVFIIVSIIFILAMAVIIGIFSSHPMGVDFTTYTEIKPEHLNNPDLLVNRRVVLRGLVTAVDPSSIILKFPDQKVISYIKKKKKPVEADDKTPEYIEYEAGNFRIDFSGRKFFVLGQPQQIETYSDKIQDPDNPHEYYEVIRDGKTYTIFGTFMTEPSMGRIYLEPYQVTLASADEVKMLSEESNRKLGRIQYILVFGISILYFLILWQGRILGPEIPPEEIEPVRDIKIEKKKSKQRKNKKKRADIVTGSDKDAGSG